MRHSLYWDDFNKRIDEAVYCINNGLEIPVRRVTVFITEKCNMKCNYCNHVRNPLEMEKEVFHDIVQKHGKDAIIHITGGEPSCVRWLYDYIAEHGYKYRFHLNTNCLIKPPAKYVKRLKVSLDHSKKDVWNELVGVNAFDRVVKNITEAMTETCLSITYTMSKQNYLHIPSFITYCKINFPDIYAIFFSVYKGTVKDLVFDNRDITFFFKRVLVDMLSLLDKESCNLLEETIDEKFRLMKEKRFPENNKGLCYLSLSERVYNANGSISGCSHLNRDGIRNIPGEKYSKCTYGCNRRLVSFNKHVEKTLNLK